MKNNKAAASSKPIPQPWTVRSLRFFIGLAVAFVIIGVLVMAYPGLKTKTKSPNPSASSSQDAASDLKIVGLSGRLSQINGQTLTLQLANGRQATLKAVSSTTIIQRLPSQSVSLSSASTIGLAALKPGDQLTVLARTSASDWLTGEAERIILEQ